MHKLEKDFCHFGDEQLRLREHLESLGKEKIVWESFRTVDTIVPVFKGKAPALSVEIMLNTDKTLKEVRIVDRVKSISAKYDSSGKLVMDDWLLKHPEATETAKVYEKKLGILLEHNYLIKKPPIPEPYKEVQKPTVAEPPKQVFQPYAIKTELPAIQKEVSKPVRHFAGKMGRPLFTPEQIEKKNRDIDRFCESKGIYIKNHPSLHKHSLKNIRKIVEKCEEKHIPFTPYRDFLTFASKTFNRDIEIIEKYNSENPELLKFDLAKHYSVLLCAPATLSENLKTCVEKKRDLSQDSI